MLAATGRRGAQLSAGQHSRPLGGQAAGRAAGWPAAAGRPAENVRLFRRIHKKDVSFLEITVFFEMLSDVHAISSFPPTVNKGWHPGSLQKGATSKDLSVVRINNREPQLLNRRGY